MKVSPSRAAAFDVLLQIENEKAFSSVLLPLYEESLSADDRALCHELVLGTLRKQIWLDRMISLMTRGKKTDAAVRIALRLAIYQLEFLDRIPHHSAVNESVNLVHRAKKSSARSFVNGVLRNFLRQRPKLIFDDDTERLSVETSHPVWLLKKWIDNFGFDRARSIATANNVQPRAAFRLIKDDSALRQDVEAFATRSEHVEGCFISERADERLRPLLRSDQIYLQDEASQMVAQSIKLQDNQTFLDVCASPGGKTGIVAKNAANRSISVIAGDLKWGRVKLLRESCERQGVTVQGIVQYDALAELPFKPERFDRVLVDAPCSGTGTIRHNPEIRYRLREDDFAASADKQLAILISASQTVRPGGRITYSTCSLEFEENEEVARRFLDKMDSFRLGPCKMADRFASGGGFARTWPDRDNMDGFFVATFIKS